MSIRIIFYVVVNLILFSTGFTQWINDHQFSEHTRKGIDYVYDLSFDSARLEFQKLTKIYPNHPAGHFFLAMVEWWGIVLNIDDESNDDKFISMLNKVIDICDNRLDEDENDLTALFYKGGSLGFRGRLYAYREDWVKAANDGRIALPIVHDAFKIAPNNYDVLLGMGIYNFYAAVIPEQYPIVKPFMIFFPSGDRQKGIIQLREASEKATYANIEAKYFLAQILCNYEKKFDEALPLAMQLNKQFPKNPLFQKYVVRCYASLGYWNETNQTCKDMLLKVKEKKYGYTETIEREAQFYLGLYEMTINNYDIALQHLYRCDELCRIIDKDGPSGYMVVTNLKIGNIYDLQSKREIAIKQYDKVLNMKDYQETHKQAERYLKTPYGK